MGLHTHLSFESRVPASIRSLGLLSSGHSQEGPKFGLLIKTQECRDAPTRKPSDHNSPSAQVHHHPLCLQVDHLDPVKTRTLLPLDRSSSPSSPSVSPDPFPNPNASTVPKSWALEQGYPGGMLCLENSVEGWKQRTSKLGITRGSRNGMNTYCRAWLSRGTRVSRKAHRALRKENETISSLTHPARPTTTQVAGQGTVPTPPALLIVRPLS